ncbi:hypothetical protein MNBD_ALPHA12-1870 [hydrothermal vent metagenome]|uniref:Uncharacterized protein n=1 Tax=hydrothermal vent metagenome TaxID=652676 RepID=A0A3B0TZC2_9ZZZZ
MPRRAVPAAPALQPWVVSILRINTDRHPVEERGPVCRVCGTMNYDPLFKKCYFKQFFCRKDLRQLDSGLRRNDALCQIIYLYQTPHFFSYFYMGTFLGGGAGEASVGCDGGANKRAGGAGEASVGCDGGANKRARGAGEASVGCDGGANKRARGAGEASVGCDGGV